MDGIPGFPVSGVFQTSGKMVGVGSCPQATSLSMSRIILPSAQQGRAPGRLMDVVFRALIVGL